MTTKKTELAEKTELNNRNRKF